MRVSQVSKDQLLQLTKGLTEGYFLFDSKLLENSDYDARQEADPHAMPVQITARDLIDQVDKYTTDTMLWESTFLDDHKEAGPLLIHFFNESKLLDMHISRWGHWNVGVVLEADSEIDLAKHLRSLLMVEMPGDGQVRFRFYETTKLALILNSLGCKERISQILGPIKTMYWQENCGPGITYWKIENPIPSQDLNTCGWFAFTKEEKKKISDASVSWFKRSVLNEVLERLKLESKITNRLAVYTPKELETILNKGYESALERNISSQDGIRFYLLTYFFNPGFMKDVQTMNVVNNNKLSEISRVQELKEMYKGYLEKNCDVIC